MIEYRDGDQLDHELFDAMVVLLGQMLRSGENMAAQLGVPMFCLKALHRLGASVTMKDLGEQMHCDRSFITMIADTLEERGLARREPNDTDRRVKNLVLTSDGLTLKRRLEGELLTQMPWSRTLDANERARLLELVRKMADAEAVPCSSATGCEQVGEVSGKPDVSQAVI